MFIIKNIFSYIIIINFLEWYFFIKKFWKSIAVESKNNCLIISWDLHFIWSYIFLHIWLYNKFDIESENFVLKDNHVIMWIKYKQKHLYWFFLHLHLHFLYTIFVFIFRKFRLASKISCKNSLYTSCENEYPSIFSWNKAFILFCIFLILLIILNCFS